MIGFSREDVCFWENFSLNLLGVGDGGTKNSVPGGEPFEAGQVLVVLGDDRSIAGSCDDDGCRRYGVSGLLEIEEVYTSVDWKTVFLLASLIPPGIAMERTGTAQYIDASLVETVQAQHALIILIALGLPTTVFRLLMTNVAATILLVRLLLK